MQNTVFFHGYRKIDAHSCQDGSFPTGVGIFGETGTLSRAVKALHEAQDTKIIVEVGPHSALTGPLREIFAAEYVGVTATFQLDRQPKPDGLLSEDSG